MKLPRARFTVRRLMVVVALAATVMGSVTYLKRRSVQFRAIYLKQAFKAEEWHYLWGKLETRRDSRSVNPFTKYKFHNFMAEKYDLAARRPWLPVNPDPPEPEYPVASGHGAR